MQETGKNISKRHLRAFNRKVLRGLDKLVEMRERFWKPVFVDVTSNKSLERASDKSLERVSDVTNSKSLERVNSKSLERASDDLRRFRVVDKMEPLFKHLDRLEVNRGFSEALFFWGDDFLEFEYGISWKKLRSEFEKIV